MKLILFIISIVDNVDTTNMIGWWKFDNNSDDSSGNGYNLIDAHHHNMSYTTSRNENTVALFNGSSYFAYSIISNNLKIVFY